MRLLFVLGAYFPKASANGVCVSRVQEALKNLGVFSDIVAEGTAEKVTDSQYGKVYTTVLTDIERLSRFQRIMAALRYPVYFPSNIKSYRHMIDTALSENSYDAIVAVLRPLDGALAAMSYSNLLIYELDSIANNDENEHGFRKYLRHRVLLAERVLYRKASYIFHMQSHKAFYRQKHYDCFSDKSTYLDIPQLIDEKISDRSSDDTDLIKVLYSGILNTRTRSPEYPVSLIKELNQQGIANVELNFYSRGDCEEMLEKEQQKTNGSIRKHGYVSLNELNLAVAETDCLLSIGNCSTGKVTSLPSKVISYMAYGKPIIHIDGGANDVAKDYLDKYPLAIVIDPKARMENNLLALHTFLQNNLGKRVPFDDVARIFVRNTPEYTAEQIIKAVSEHCCSSVTKR